MKFSIGLLGCVGLCLMFTPGCTTTRYREGADKEAYSIIDSKTPAVPNMDPEFTIEQADVDPLASLPKTEPDDRTFLGSNAAIEEDAYVIGLEEALGIAVNHNRTYQTQKENVFLQALALSLERHRFDFIFSGELSGEIAGTTTDNLIPSPYLSAGDFVRDFGALTGTAADLVEAYAEVVESAVDISGLGDPDVDIERIRSTTGVTRFGVEKLLSTGGRVAVSITSNFFRFLTGDPSVDTTSALVGSIVQPLWRGAGSKVALENLTQAERDMLYALRDFARFRKEFTVDVTSSYYNVLQARDAVRNNWRGYQSFLQSLERGRAYAAEGRMTPAELGRLEQAALSSESSWINSLANYSSALDRFKILLGLPTETKIVLDPQELDHLVIEHPDISPDDAVKVALVTRLDLYNLRDEVEDAQRKVVVAENNLRPDVDFVATYGVQSPPDGDFTDLDFRREDWSVGLDVGLPFDRKAERNAYRAALISQDRARRNLELAEDTVALDVRDAWRDLEQAKLNYEINLREVELNARRVEEQDLRAELGMADAIDQVDALNDLIRAQNSLTSALVNHTITRLVFWRDMGILYIKKDGQWEELPQETMPTIRLDRVIPGAPVDDTAAPAPVDEAAAEEADAA